MADPIDKKDVVDAPKQDVVDAKTTEETKNDVDATKKTVEAVNVTNTELNNLKESEVGRLFRWGKEKISANQVVEVVNALKNDEFKGKIIDFIKSGQIDGMQKFINEKIKSGYIDKDALSKELQSKGIRFDGSIDVDGRFGPQTLETLRHIVEVQEGGQEKPKEGEKPGEGKDQKESKEVTDLSWMKAEMMKVIDGIRDTGRYRYKDYNWKIPWTSDTGENWDLERGYGEDNFNIDPERHRISISTWGKNLGGDVNSHEKGNRCEMDWTTGKIYVICDDIEYAWNVGMTKMELDDKGYPTESSANNHLSVQAFARIGNLMNRLKMGYVYNGGNDSLEESGGDIEYNNSKLLGGDTEVVYEDAFKKFNYPSVGVKFDKKQKIHMACLLNAIKIKKGNLDWPTLNHQCNEEHEETTRKILYENYEG